MCQNLKSRTPSTRLHSDKIRNTVSAHHDLSVTYPVHKYRISTASSIKAYKLSKNDISETAEPLLVGIPLEDDPEPTEARALQESQSLASSPLRVVSRRPRQGGSPGTFLLQSSTCISITAPHIRRCNSIPFGGRILLHVVSTYSHMLKVRGARFGLVRLSNFQYRQEDFVLI